MADPLSQDPTAGNDPLAASGPIRLAMADKPPEVPPSGSFPVGKTPPSRFLFPTAEPQVPGAIGGAPPAAPPAKGVLSRIKNYLRPSQSAKVEPEPAQFAKGREAITDALNEMHGKGTGNAWVETPEGGQGLYLRVRPEAIDVANISFDKKGTGAFRNYIDHIETEAKRLRIPTINVENIFNERLIGFLRDRGYAQLNQGKPVNMMKMTRGSQPVYTFRDQ